VSTEERDSQFLDGGTQQPRSAALKEPSKNHGARAVTLAHWGVSRTTEGRRASLRTLPVSVRLNHDTQCPPSDKDVAKKALIHRAWQYIVDRPLV